MPDRGKRARQEFPDVGTFARLLRPYVVIRYASQLLGLDSVTLLRMSSELETKTV